MDTFLMVVTIILAIMLIFVNFYLLALYCHPDDSGWGSSLYCKILVILGLTLSWAQVLMLPLDAANSRGLGSGIDMGAFWQILYMVIIVMVAFLLPFAQSFYESDEDKTMRERFCYALYQQICFLVIWGLIFFISYGYLRFADIPVTVNTKQFMAPAIERSKDPISQLPSSGQMITSDTLTYEVTFPVYCMAFMSFFGYVFLVIFGGVGLPALPIDMIMDFVNRPKVLTTKEGVERKSMLKRKTQQMIDEGQKLKEDSKEAQVVDGWWSKYKEKRKVGGMFNKYKFAVLTLERDFQIFKLELEYQNTNPCVFWIKLFLGSIFIVVSFIWWLHILLFIVIKVNGHPASNFMNQILLGLESANAGFLSTAVFAFLSLYLLWCTQKGNLKFGVRIPFLFSLHIMKQSLVNETWMNTFLFNVSLILISSVAVTQFCAKAFSQYVRLSTIDLLFSTQIQYMRFFTYFYDNNVYEIALLVWAALTTVYLLFKRSDKPDILKQIEELQKHNGKV